MTQDPEADRPGGPEADLDPDTLAGIRSLMAEAKKAPPRRATPAPEPTPETPQMTAAPVAAPEPPHPDLPPIAEPATDESAPRAGLIARQRAKLLGFRPTPRQVVLAGLALLVLFRPWLVVGIVLLMLFLLIGVFLVLGYDGFWRRAMALAHWYARRRPARAAVLHARLDRFAMRWDAILDRFPEGTVDGLYLPDFGDLAEADARHAAALDRRLDGLREG